MNKLTLKRCFIIAAAMALLAVFTAAPAGAGDLKWKLKGEYAWTSTSTCASSMSGFDMTPDPLPPGPRRNLTTDGKPAPGVSYNYAIQGEFLFDGRGQFTFAGEYMGVMVEPYPNPAVTPAPTSAQYTAPIHHYKTNGLGTYNVELKDNGLFVEIIFTSWGIEGTDIVLRGAIFQGRLTSSSVGSVIFLSTTSPIPEDVDSSLYPAAMQRICNASGSMVKLGPWRELRLKE